jgi:hypothetical protein
MAKIGDVLTAPEAGWQRIQNTDPLFTYIGESWQNRSDSLYSGGTAHTSFPNGSEELGMQIKFDFKGSKLRIIAQMNNASPSNIEIEIDGVTYTYSEYATNTGATGCQSLVYEKLDLQNVIHSVVITKVSTGFIQLDAIDIDEDGELLPYNPIPEEPDQALLRVTMIDSSEREYKLPQADIHGFITWFTRAVGTGTSVYALNKMTGSKEYLAFDKIISFEVIPVA